MHENENMDLRTQIGQHFVCGFDGPTLEPSFIEAVKRYKIGNIILFARNIKSKTQLYALCQEIQDLVRSECGHDALITIDQEGGMVTRLSPDCTNVPSAMALSATGDEQLARQAGVITATELRALGVNVDFAPSLDVNSNPDNPVIGVRSFSDDPKQVTRFGLAMIEGLQEGGVMAVGKHFPGHGDTHLDSHVALPVVEGGEEQLAIHLEPFRKAISAGVQGIMSSHILFPALEPDPVPATLSRTIMTDLLRSEYGFKGLVFTDCMEMQAIADHFGTVEASLQALQAGVDVVCISHHVELACQAVELVEAALADGRLDADSLKQSTKRILQAKTMLSELPPPPLSVVACENHRQSNAQLHQKSLTLVNDAPFSLGSKPLVLGPRPFRATNVSNDEDVLSFAPSLAALLGCDGITTSDNPKEQEIEQLSDVCSAYSAVVVGTYNGHLHPGQLALVNRLSQELPTLCVALRNPYDLAYVTNKVRSIAAYAYTESAIHSLAQVVLGKAEATGVLPVALVEQGA